MIRTTISLLLAIVISLWVSTPVWAGYEEGKAAFDKGDYEEALKVFRPLAESEDINAQYSLGMLYRNGWGVPQDDSEAAKWLRLAAHQGHVEAQYSLGYMYEHGQGLTKDMTEAKRWYRMAANQGDSDAQENLRIIYYEEFRTPKNRSGDQGDYAMSANPSDWIDTVLGVLIGLEDTMTIGDVVLIAAVILIILVPVILPFSFYRIKPMIKEISDQAAQRDLALLEEIRKMNRLLHRIADTSGEPAPAEKAMRQDDEGN